MNTYQQQQVETLAYQIWEREGRPLGRQEAHWWQAEQHVTSAAAPKESLEIDDLDLNEQGDETLTGNERGGD